MDSKLPRNTYHGVRKRNLLRIGSLPAHVFVRFCDSGPPRDLSASAAEQTSKAFVVGFGALREWEDQRGERVVAK